MNVKVKATGEIITLRSRQPRDSRIDPDYWTRLEHQVAIAAMGGMCGNTKYNDYAW